MYMCVVLYMDLPSGRKKLRLGKLKSKFFKDFSQKSACMYMSAHTLQGPVPTVDLRTPEENATTQHNVYTLATERYHFEPYIVVYRQMLWNAEDEYYCR